MLAKFYGLLKKNVIFVNLKVITYSVYKLSSSVCFDCFRKVCPGVGMVYKYA